MSIRWMDRSNGSLNQRFGGVRCLDLSLNRRTGSSLMRQELTSGVPPNNDLDLPPRNGLNIDPSNIVGFMHDSAPVNSALLRNLGEEYSSCIDLPCISHLINLLGERMKFNHSEKIWDLYKRGILTHHGIRIRTIFPNEYEPIKTFSETRWYSEVPCMVQLLHLLLNDDLLPSLEQAYDDGIIRDLTVANQFRIYISTLEETDIANIEMELAVICDYSEYFQRICTKMESDALLIHEIYEVIDNLKGFCGSKTEYARKVRKKYNNNDQIDGSASATLKDAVREDVADYLVKMKATTGRSNHLFTPLKLYYAAKFLNPYSVRTFKFENSSDLVFIFQEVKYCTVGKVYSMFDFADLESEVDIYIKLSKYQRLHMSPTEILGFWINNSVKMPNLSKCALDILTLPTSSASIERIYSILDYILTKRNGFITSR